MTTASSRNAVLDVLGSASGPMGGEAILEKSREGGVKFQQERARAAAEMLLRALWRRFRLQ